MNYFRIKQTGFFAGDFVITDEECSFSIGNYVEVLLRGELYDTGETFLSLRHGEVSIMAFPLILIGNGINVIWRLPVGRILQHCLDCLTDGVNTVMPVKHEYKNWTWYTPKINGKVKDRGLI